MKSLLISSLILFLGNTITFSQIILLEGAQSQGHPTIPYNATKPPSPSISLGTSFPDPAPSASISRIFRIKNEEAFRGPGLIVSASSDNPQFTITGLASPIKAGSQDLFTITYAPSSESAVTAEIEVTSNDPAKPSYRFRVSGAGGSRSAEFLNSDNEVLLFSNTPSLTNDTDFGQITRAAIAPTRNFVLKNTGSLSLSYETLQLGQTGFESDFSRSNATIAAGESLPFFIRPKTDTAGVFEQFVSANDLSGVSPNLLFEVSVEILGAPGISDPCRKFEGSNSCFPLIGPLNMGNQEVGTSSENTLEITNDGEETLFFDAQAITSNNPVFSASGLPASLNAGARAQFTVTYTPVANGVTSGELTIHSNAAGRESLIIPVTGDAFGFTAPEIQLKFADLVGFYRIDPSNISFQQTELGEEDRRYFEISNFGNAPLIINNASTDSPAFSLSGGPGEDDAFVLSEELPITIPPSGHRLFSVLFQPTTVGIQNVTLSFDTNLPDGPETYLLTAFEGTSPPDLSLGSFRKVGNTFELTIPSFAGAENGDQFRLVTTTTLSEDVDWIGLPGFDDLLLSETTETVVIIPAAAFTDGGSGILPQVFLRLERVTQE